MGSIFTTVLKMFGWQKLVLMAWNAAYADMLKASLRTETNFDENFLKVANEIIITLTGKHDEIAKPKELK